MQAHVIEIETLPAYSNGLRTFPPMHRWRCSCGRAGEETTKPRSARNGGARHVAAMERGQR